MMIRLRDKLPQAGYPGVSKAFSATREDYAVPRQTKKVDNKGKPDMRTRTR